MKKRLYLHAFLLASLAYLFSYLLYHLGTYAEFSGKVLYYLGIFARDFVHIIAPPFLASVAMLAYRRLGVFGAFTHSLCLSIPYLFHAIPNYYVEFSLIGYNTGEVLMLLPFQVLPSFALSFLTIAILLAANVLISSYFAKKEANFQKKAVPYNRFDIKNRKNLSVMLAPFLMFFLYFVFEVIDTASFLSQHFSTIRPFEIIYICIRYLFLLSCFILSYLLVSKFRDKYISE